MCVCVYNVESMVGPTGTPEGPEQCDPPVPKAPPPTYTLILDRDPVPEEQVTTPSYLWCVSESPSVFPNQSLLFSDWPGAGGVRVGLRL